VTSELSTGFWFKQHPWRTALLVLLLSTTACIIYLSVPHGYGRLEKLESDLDQLARPGARIEEVQAGLKHHGIEYYEWTETEFRPVLRVGSDVKISANAGDRVLQSRTSTGAWRFPCDEQLDIYLIFDSRGELTRRYIGRFHQCP
jgi:hypothetical protein